MKTKQIILIIAIILVIIVIGGLGFSYYQKLTYKVSNPVATIEVENYGTIKVELYPDIAPNTVANFIKLANNGFYNTSTFHRVVKDFMIQGGSPNGDSQKSPTLKDLDPEKEEKEYVIKGEMSANGFTKNTLRHEEGVISVARVDYTKQLSPTLTEESYNSGNSQFFIMTKNTPSLNGMYTAFGKVIEGMDVVHKIEEAEIATETSESGEVTSTETPANPPKITSITVDTFGVDYGMPETLEPFDQQAWLYKQLGL